MEFPTTDVQGEIKKVCQNSSVINKRQTEIKWTDEQIKSMDYQSFLKLEEQQFDGFLNDNGNEREKKKQNRVTMCADSVRDTINRIAAVTLCYDNSIVSHIIREIHSKLRAHQLRLLIIPLFRICFNMVWYLQSISWKKFKINGKKKTRCLRNSSPTKKICARIS
jgi:hypothetical protein